MRHIVIFGLAAILSLAALSCATSDDQAPSNAASPMSIDAAAYLNPRVIPPDAMPGGKSYAEWSTAWWQWLWSAPVSVNPGLDETGENIDWGQSGNVWFLAPNYGGVSERSATIPPGKTLFIDVAAFFCSPVIGDPSDEQELRNLCGLFAGMITDLVLEVDGVPLMGWEGYRFASPELFSFTVPEDNMFGLFGFPTPAGTYYPGVSDGYFVMLAPLAAGQHTIHIFANLPEPFVDSEVTIHLTVSGKKAMGQING